MKLSVIIIDLILILSISLPYYLFIHAGRKGRQGRKKIINKIIQTHGILPNIQEQWRNSYIGIDSTQNKLLYVKLDEQQAEEDLIPLNKVRDCSLIKEYKRIRKRKEKEDVLVLLAIELHYRHPKSPAARVVFYDSASMTGEDFEMQRAEKWLGFINEHLKSRQSDTVAA
jgi:hypothetical protein